MLKINGVGGCVGFEIDFTNYRISLLLHPVLVQTRLKETRLGLTIRSPVRPLPVRRVD